MDSTNENNMDMDVLSQSVHTGADEYIESVSVIPLVEEDEDDETTTGIEIETETRRGGDDDEESWYDSDGNEYSEGEDDDEDEDDDDDDEDDDESDSYSDLSASESEAEIEIDVEGSVTSIGNRNSVSGHAQQFEYEHVLEEGSTYGSKYATRQDTDTVGGGGVEDVYDEDIGGQSVASASVVAAGLAGCSMVSSSKRKGMLIVAVVSLGIMTIVVYTLWQKIREMRKELKELEKQQDMGLNDKDVQSITTQVLEDFLRRETMAVSDQTPVSQDDQPQGEKRSHETVTTTGNVENVNVVDAVPVPVSVVSTAKLDVGLDTIEEDDDDIDTYSVEDLVRDINSQDKPASSETESEYVPEAESSPERLPVPDDEVGAETEAESECVPGLEVETGSPIELEPVAEVSVITESV